MKTQLAFAFALLTLSVPAFAANTTTYTCSAFLQQISPVKRLNETRSDFTVTVQDPATGADWEAGPIAVQSITFNSEVSGKFEMHQQNLPQLDGTFAKSLSAVFTVKNGDNESMAGGVVSSNTPSLMIKSQPYFAMSQCWVKND